MYKTTCTVNGKTYIGKHKTEDKEDDYLGSGKLLRRAIAKHGRESFIKEILFIFDSEEEMNIKEAELVTIEHCADDRNYNICEGGKGGWSYVNREGLGISDRQKEVARALGGRNFPRTRTEEWRKKVSQSLTGMDNGWTGRKHTEETKAKMSRNHNPASHPRGPRGPYRKRTG